MRSTTAAIAATTIAAIMAWTCAAFAQVAGPYNEMVNQGRAARTITPSDTVDFALGATRWIYSGATAACVLNVLLADDTSAVAITAIPAGTFLPLRAKRVFATTTTCTVMVGIW